MRLLTVLFWQEFVHHALHWLKNCQPPSTKAFGFPFAMSTKEKSTPRVEHMEGTAGMTILDLPELALDCILGKLSPAGLATMACVCSSLRDRLRDNHLWERHMREKWGQVIGQAARREWERYISSRKVSQVSGGATGSLKPKGWMGSLSCIWPLSWFKTKLDTGNRPWSPLPMDSIMSWYLALESGRFWFPAQVYNRENGHVGFLLSCYDSELCYDRHTDTFYARYPPHGRRPVKMEEGIEWDRVRAPPVDTSAHDLHVSDCLNDLCPGDHIEIQWRKNKEFPYGWWYGVVGHLELCDGNEHHCQCRQSDTIILKFNQYTHGSRWRQTAISRKDHQEEGNETDGFYGGIRKLHSKDEIASWRQLWPTEILR